MSKEAPVILDSSDEAATFVTVSGWCSRLGHFYGDGPHAEQAARYEGCTHVLCDCGATVPRGYTKCSDCRSAVELAKYQAMPKKAWDGVGMLYSDFADRYFNDWSEVEDYCEEAEDLTPKDLCLIICEPQYASEVDGDEIYRDDIPEDLTLDDVAKDLAALFDELNGYIREYKPLLSWGPGKFAVDLSTSA